MAAAPTPEVGAFAPAIALPGWHQGREAVFDLAAPRDGALVLAFYPRDDTPVCTRQMCDYGSSYDAFTALDAQVWGISAGDMATHRRFAEKFSLPFPLLLDADRSVAGRYGGSGVVNQKRSTFVVDMDNRIVWRHVSNTGLSYKDSRALVEVLERLKS